MTTNKSLDASVGGIAPFAQRFDRKLVALVNRTTQGFTLEEYERATELGYEGYLEYHLDHESIDDSAAQPYLDGLVTIWMTPKEVQDYTKDLGELAEHAPTQLMGAATYRSINSKRQLFERVVEFWTDHFNINVEDKSCRFLKATDDRDVIRPNAFGTFHSLLDASAHSGAMMFYLDNYANHVGAPQENYAREIMELHSLGVEGGYTEDDIKEVARCLTGWQLVAPLAPNFGQFLYTPALHDTGEKVVLGNVIPAGGQESDGLAVIQILADHANTANFVGRKLASWLLVHEPSQELVDQVAQTYLSSGGDVKEMIRTILSKANLTAAKPWKNRKFKRPFHFAVSLIRALGATVTSHDVLVQELELLGQKPFAFPPPTGYDDTPDAWGSSLHPRWSFASRLMANAIPGVGVNAGQVTTLVESFALPTLAHGIDAMLTGGQMAPLDRARVQTYLNSFETVDWPVLAEAIALAASSPSFQLY